MLKRISSVISLSLFLAAVPHFAGAHGGGLNRDGCHRETATGGYHCHREKSDDRKTWETVGYVAGGILAVGLVLWLIRKPQQQFDIPEKGLRLMPAHGDQVGAFLEVRW